MTVGPLQDDKIIHFRHVDFQNFHHREQLSNRKKNIKKDR